MEKIFSLEQIQNFERFYRVNFLTKICGPQSANLVGTIDEQGISNLAIFNSVTHISSNPPTLGFFQRPLTVPRQTYQNIKQAGFFTINSVGIDSIKKAHQTSAKFEKGVSEFEKCQFSEQFIEGFPAPFVSESSIKIGLSLEEEHLLQSSGNILIVGKIQKIIINSNILEEDGNILLEKANLASLAGLDSYFKIEKIARFEFARPHLKVSEKKI